MLGAPGAGASQWIDFVEVGNPGNAPDSNGRGAVAYEYRIARTETTIAEYARFLNAAAASDPYGLYNPSMATDGNIAGIARSGISGGYTYSVLGSGSRPISYVSWFDAARYANWLHNGGGSGSTEGGAYTLNGATSGIIERNSGATIWIPSNDEWYKAAYHDPTPGAGGGDNYWLYPQRTDVLGSNSVAANYFDGDLAVTQQPGLSPTQNYLTEAGAYAGQESFYGTVDQGGNVFEWIDLVSGSQRGVRGGSWSNGGSEMRSLSFSAGSPGAEFPSVGFRIAAMIPEPATASLTVLGLALALRRRR